MRGRVLAGRKDGEKKGGKAEGQPGADLNIDVAPRG